MAKTPNQPKPDLTTQIQAGRNTWSIFTRYSKIGTVVVAALTIFVVWLISR